MTHYEMKLIVRKILSIKAFGWLVLIFFLVNEGQAQRVKIDLIRPVAVDFPQSPTRENVTSLDTLKSIESPVVERYSQRMLSEKRDALIEQGKVPDLDTLQEKQMSHGELVDELNAGFFHKGFQQSSAMAGAGGKEVQDGLTPNDRWAQPEALQLKELDNRLLRPVEKRVANQSELSEVLDGQKQKLKEQRLKVKSKESEFSIKEQQWHEKPRFGEKVYFEGILGMSNISNVGERLFLLSPAMAYHVNSPISIGFGPVMQFVEGKESFKMDPIRLRTFGKYEVWSKRAYLQVENSFQPQKKEEISGFSRENSWLLGAGGIIPLSPSLGINLAAFYDVNGRVTKGTSLPVLLRLGISTIPSKKRTRK